MNQNKNRIGNFTSSEIVQLTKSGKTKGSFGDAAKTYILECNIERKLGISIETDTDAYAFSWGKLVEKMAFNQLGTEYILTSTETDMHPTIPYWSGSKDGHKEDDGRTVIDIKCPLTRKSFCELVEPLYHGITGAEHFSAIRDGWREKNGFEHKAHKDAEKYYWQLVSNAIINNCKYAELIVYMPYKNELQTIRDMIMELDVDPTPYFWIHKAPDEKLPHLIKGGYYKNLNVIRFEVPQADKDFLTHQVEEAGKQLIKL